MPTGSAGFAFGSHGAVFGAPVLSAPLLSGSASTTATRRPPTTAIHIGARFTKDVSTKEEPKKSRNNSTHHPHQPSRNAFAKPISLMDQRQEKVTELWWECTPNLNRVAIRTKKNLPRATEPEFRRSTRSKSKKYNEDFECDDSVRDDAPSTHHPHQPSRNAFAKPISLMDQRQGKDTELWWECTPNLNRVAIRTKRNLHRIEDAKPAAAAPTGKASKTTKKGPVTEVWWTNTRTCINNNSMTSGDAGSDLSQDTIVSLSTFACHRGDASDSQALEMKKTQVRPLSNGTGMAIELKNLFIRNRNDDDNDEVWWTRTSPNLHSRGREVLEVHDDDDDDHDDPLELPLAKRFRKGNAC